MLCKPKKTLYQSWNYQRCTWPCTSAQPKTRLRLRPEPLNYSPISDILLPEGDMIRSLTHQMSVKCSVFMRNCIEYCHTIVIHELDYLWWAKLSISAVIQLFCIKIGLLGMTFLIWATKLEKKIFSIVTFFKAKIDLDKCLLIISQKIFKSSFRLIILFLTTVTYVVVWRKAWNISSLD